MNDIIIATNDEDLYNQTKISLSKHFEIKDLGLLNYCLGIEFKLNDDGIFILQTKYINDVLVK